MVTHEGANAFFTALPVAASAAMDVKIDETRQNEGTLWLGSWRQRSAVDNGDRVTSEFHLAGYPPVGRKNGAFRRCEGIGGH
jgi:hypothetical protein